MSENNTKIIRTAVSGFKFTLAAQIAALALSILRSIILPKIFAVEDYGYWQIYVLYSTYVGIFMLGFNDGVYLLYGKYQYSELPFRKLRAADKWYVFMMTSFSLIAVVLSFFVFSGQRRFAMIGVSIDILLMGINGLLIYVLQITNQMKAYSFYTVLDKIVLLTAIVVLIISPARDYRIIIVADVFSKLVVSIGLLRKCKDLFFGERESSDVGFREFGRYIKVGISLMFAQLIGQLLTGIGRFIIDAFGDITQYAYYSFGITVTNLILVFITAVSLVLYPALKRLPETEYKKYFCILNDSIVICDYLALGLCFPAIYFIKWFLPKYLPILAYLHILFCMIIMQAKVQLVMNTFYKVIRKELAMLKANVLCILVFLLSAAALYLPTKSLTAIALSTFLASAFRSYYSEIYLRKCLGISMEKKIVVELAFVVTYLLTISFTSVYFSMVVYTILIFLVIMLYKDTIMQIMNRILLLRKREET